HRMVRGHRGAHAEAEPGPKKPCPTGRRGPFGRDARVRRADGQGPMTDSDLDEVRRRVSELGDWFHNIDLGGVRTAPDHFLGDYPGFQWRRIAPSLPSDLHGRTVLDIGCNAGFFSIEMKRRG